MQQASLTTRLLVVILILGILALAIALEVTGRVEFRGR
jgi:type II secretory pathway pseudopilin PulG